MTYDEIKKKHLHNNDKNDKGATNSNRSSTYAKIRSKHFEPKKENNSKVDVNDLLKRLKEEEEAYNSAIKEAEKASYGMEAFKKTVESQRQHRLNINSLKSELESYRNRLGKDVDIDSAISSLDKMKSGYDAIASNSQTMSQFKNEDEYNDALKSQKEYEAITTFDLEAGQKEIDDILNGDEITALKKEQSDLQKQIRKLGNPGKGKQFQKKQQLQKQLSEINSKIKGIENQVSQKKAYLNRAKYVQNGIKITEEAKNAKDFDEKSKYVSTEANGIWDKLTADSLGFNDSTYEYINNINGYREKYKAEHIRYSRDNPYDDGESYLEEKGLDHINEDEIKIYNYFYATEGKEKAEEFLDSIQETLNYRKATEEFGDLEGRTFAELLFGIEAGLDQFSSGMKNLFNTSDDYIPPSATQMTSGMVREDLEGVGFKILGSSIAQIGYDLTTTTSNMLPSILTSTAVGFINPVAGQVLGTGLMGASASGNAYAEMINLGYDKGQARLYSGLVGASEATLQYLLGGIGKLGGGKLTNELVVGIANNMDNAFARIAVKLGGNALGEFTEEYLQEVLNPFFKNITLGTEEDIKLFSTEALYAGILGALSAGVLEGGPTIVSDIKTTHLGKKVQNIDGGVERLKKLGTTFSADSVAYEIADKVTEETGAYKIGLLLQEVGGTLSEQNVSDITIELTKKGMDETSAKKLAKTYQSFLNEEMSLTDEQVKVLEECDPLTDVLRKSIIGRNTSTYQRTREFDDLYKLATDMEAAPTTQVDTKPTPQTIAPYSTEYVDSVAKEFEEMGMPHEQAQIMALAKLSTPTEGKTSPTKENLVESKYEVSAEGKTLNTKSGDIAVNTEVNIKDKVSADGKTVQVSTGEAITINKDNAIAKIETVDGERVVYFNTDKGMVSSKDVSYASESEALVYESFVDLNPAFANAVIKNYDGKVPVQTYIKGMREGIVLYGMHNFQGVGKDISKNTYFAELSAEDQAFALKLGSAYADMVAKKQGKTLRTAIKNAAEKAEVNKNTSTKATSKKGRVSFEGGVVAKGKLQKRTVSLAKHLASAIGIDIVFYDARTTTDENSKGANGYFDEDTNTIHLDLQNSASDAKTIAFTLSHELVHFIKKWSPEKFNTFSKFLMENYAKHGVNTSQLLANKMADLGTKDADLAYEEMIADACETMLLDSNAVYKLMELRKADLELFEKIKLHIYELLNKLRNMYKELGLQPTSDEAKALLKMTDVLEQMYALFEEAAVDAAQNYQAVQNANEIIFGEESVDVGKTESGVKNQLKNHKKIGEDATAYNDRHKNVHKAILQVGIESMYEMAEVMLPYLEEEGILPPDIPGKTVFKNGSYGRTGENTTLYVRTLTYEDFKDRVAENLGRPLTVSESLLVSQKIYDIATEPQCIYCYVAADRKAYDGYLGEYWKAMDKYIKAMRNGGDSKALYTEYLAGRKNTDQQQKRWSQWETIAKSGKDYISAKDLTTKRKRDALIAKKNAFSEQIKDAQRYAQSASWAKTVFDYRAYKGDILKMSSKFVDMLNSEYGLRMYSFSDYTPAFIVENMQMLIDASVKGLKSLAYTKDTDYAEIFASTGQAINVSCFAKWDAESGTYVEDNRQGANWETTKSLRKQYRNVGAVMVATNDAMVEWALKQDWVDVVIPYHIVKTGTTIANEYQWNNYTSESADRVGNKTANIYPTEHNNDFATYSNLLNERGITPRFSRWYDKVASGELTEAQYMKLVNEVRLPASELSAVTPNFNLEAAKNSFGVDNEGNVIKGGFVDKGGYMGGWYRQGVDVNQEVMAVSEDIKAGKSSLDVDYGMSKAAKEKVEEKYKPSVKKQAKKETTNPYQGKTMYVDSDIYNYDFMTNLDPMKVETMPPLSAVKDNGKVSQDKAVEMGLDNAKSIGRRISADKEQYAIKNAYTQREIILGKKGLSHSLDASKIHRLRTNARLSAIGAYIVQNAVPINGLKKENQQANGTYAMACLVNDGRGYVVAIVTVDEFDSTVVGIDVVDSVHSINGRFLAKKEDSRSSSRELELGQESISTTAISTINITDFLEIVNSTHRSILSNDVLRHFDLERPSNGHYANRVLFQKKMPTNRELLSNALESAIDTSTQAGKYELKLLKQYQDKIDTIEKEEAHLAEVNAQIKEISFGKNTDRSKLKDLNEDKVRTNNRINIYDKQLMRLEAMKPIKDILTREKEKVRKRTEEKGKQALAEYRKEALKVRNQMIGEARKETRQKISESRQKTEMKAKIKKVVGDLSKLLNRGTKERNVKLELQDAVGKALRTADVLFSNEITNADIVRLGVESVTPAEEKALEKYAELLDKLGKAEDEAEIKKVKGAISGYDSRYKDLFIRERARLNRETVSNALDALAIAYADLKNSTDDYVKNNAYVEGMREKIVNLSNDLQGVTIKDMSYEQLKSVYDMYAMVKHMVQQANSIFREGKYEDLMTNISNVQMELDEISTSTKDPTEIKEKIADFLRGFTWNELKPYAAFERLGSQTFQKLFWDVVEADNVWARDIEEAKNVIESARKKHGFKKWDTQKAVTIKSANGLDFKLTLEDMMSIYAYSKRPQAEDHMTVGGFVFDVASTYKDKKGKFTKTYKHKKLSETYRVDHEVIQSVMKELAKVPGAMQYVDEVQGYLTKLGEKGNEVSRVMYGIDLFKEEVYFPLQSAADYRSSVEQTLNATQTTASLKNIGMSKETVPKASNPIVLKSFDNVALDHINQMAKYHAYVVPIENLSKVFNNVNKGSGEYISTQALISSKFGESAKRYFNQFITDLNGGSLNGGASNPLANMFATSKAVSVGANMSVFVQQYFAIVRALDEMNPKYFVPFLNGEASKSNEKQYEELKKYAPVGIIKQIGGFDMGANRSALDYIGDTETRLDAKKVRRKVKDAAMWLPGKMDEIGWSTIWRAVKKEIADTTNHKVGTKEFFEACGKRFTEIVAKTQVYDSVTSRSGYMRSKHETVKYLTSFMGEPTAIVNKMFTRQLELHRAIKSKDKSRIKAASAGIARTSTVLILSTVLTSLAKSLPYAMRDDDEEDKALLERWAKHFGEATFSDMNPLNMLPVGRDLVSIWEGWDVERPDTTLISDIFTTFKKAMDDGCTAEEAMDLAGSLSNILGYPLKNVIRDVKGIVRLVGDIADDITPTDIGGAFGEGFIGEDKSKDDRLYDAVVNGDTARIEVLKSNYDTDSKYNTALAKAIVANDSEIVGVASDYINEEFSSYDSKVDELIALGFTPDSAVKAIKKVIGLVEDAAQAEADGDTETYDEKVKELLGLGYDESQLMADVEYLDAEPSDDTEKAKSRWEKDDYVAAVTNGDTTMAEIIKADLIETDIQNGKTEDEAEKSLDNALNRGYKEDFFNGDMSESEVESWIKKTHPDYTTSDIYWELKRWKKEKEHQDDPDYSYSKYGEYYEAILNGDTRTMNAFKFEMQKHNNYKTKVNTQVANVIKKTISDHFRPIYKEATPTERKKLKAKLLTAYTSLGFAYGKMSVTIDKWLTED